MARWSAGVALRMVTMVIFDGCLVEDEELSPRCHDEGWGGRQMSSNDVII
jgi:hypothetical protein